MPAPSPDIRHPIASWKGTAFLKAIVDDPRIEVGDYSYYDDSRGPEHFVARCVRYHFDWIGDR
ncbi:MAG: chloramphenicol acetyltransferase, partial [Beijerinckiaceae bacterium]